MRRSQNENSYKKYYKFTHGRGKYLDTLRIYACGAKENLQKP